MTTVELWNSAMTYRYPNLDDEVEGLRFSSLMYGGFATCSFRLYRKPWRHYPELAVGGVVQIRSRHQIVWAGRISAPTADTSNLSIDVEADGPIEMLKRRLSLVSLSSAQYGGAWITDNVLPEFDLESGVVENGYQFSSGMDFSPHVYYAEAVEQINSANGYRYGFFTPQLSSALKAKFFDFHAVSQTPDYYLDMADCQSQIQYTIEGVENRLRVTYSPDGSLQKYFWWPDENGDPTSVGLYGLRDGTLDIPGVSSLARAQQVATVALNWRKVLRPASDIVASRITDTAGNDVPLPEVQPGRVLHVRGLNPGEFTLTEAQAVNQLCTWPIVLAENTVDAGTITLSPGGLSAAIERVMSRMELAVSR